MLKVISLVLFSGRGDYGDSRGGGGFRGGGRGGGGFESRLGPDHDLCLNVGILDEDHIKALS